MEALTHPNKLNVSSKNKSQNSIPEQSCFSSVSNLKGNTEILQGSNKTQHKI